MYEARAHITQLAAADIHVFDREPFLCIIVAFLTQKMGLADEVSVEV